MQRVQCPSDRAWAGRVLVVAPQPCFDVRGTPLNVQQMCRALIGLGFEVHLATYPMGQEPRIPGLVYHRVPRIPFVRTVPIGFSMAKVFLDVLLLLETVKLLLKGRFAVVHAVEEGAFFAVPIARFFRTPAIADLDSDISDQLRAHGSIGVRALAGAARFCQTVVYRHATCLLTVCQVLTQRVQGMCPGRTIFQIEDIPLPSADRDPDPTEIRRLERELGMPVRRIVLYTGNLEPYQGVDMLIDAIPALLERYPDAAVVAVGGEPEQIRCLRRRAEALGVGDALCTPGPQPVERMAAFMGWAEVLVSPRREGENTPLKVYTYMLSGRPIVATNLVTHTQVLDERTAILTEPTPQGLARGLIRALDHPGEAGERGRRARQRVRDHHSFEQFRAKLAEVYAFVTSRESCRPRRSAGSPETAGPAGPAWSIAP